MELQYRQGDVLLTRVETIPQMAFKRKPNDKIVLAYGEATGHTHWIDARLATMYVHEGITYISANPGAKLVHDEHGPIAIKPGRYRVARQRMYVAPVEGPAYDVDMSWMD